MEQNRLPSLESVRAIIQSEATEGTGAVIMTRMEAGKPPALQIGFEDLGWKRSPRLHITPHGMHAYRITLEFGNFSRSVFDRMNSADDESHELAISLIEATANDVASLHFPAPLGRRWTISSEFRLQAISTRCQAPGADERIRTLSRTVIVPVMSALAELNGYDIIENEEVHDTSAMEGAIRIALIRRRERNPRNRLLAIRIHGTACKVCGDDHARNFGFESSLVEVHHLQPLSLAGTPKAYDPKTDLVPLCPTCHRAAHRRRPLPYSVAELRQMLTVSQPTMTTC